MARLAALYCCLLFSITLIGQNLPSDYQLVWSDDFNEDGRPNPESWRFENGFVRNNELQWYQEENAWCEDGVLIIEARRTNMPNPDYDSRSDDWRQSRPEINYTSSSLKTKGLYSFRYGILEIKAKISAQDGLWPAIWTLGIEGRWPGNGECDIMEYYNGQLLANFAWDSGEKHQPVWDSVKKPVKDTFDDSKFHIWKLLWNEQQMSIYLDDKLLNEVSLERTINVSDGRNPFHQPHYILLNLAIGSNGGDPSETEFPSRYEIDYVRVYQNVSQNE